MNCRFFARFSAISLVVLLLAGAGCANLGEPVTRTELPLGAPTAEAIVADLAANDAAIETFRAAGSFVLESPKLEATQRFRGGRILFRRPADLYVQGNHRVTNIPLFRLTAVGDEFLMEFPTSKEDSFYQLEGEEFADVPFSVAPAEIAREMFLAEDWSALEADEVRVIDYDPAAETATLAVGKGRRPRRLVTVARVNPDAPAWVVIRNERYEDNQLLAVTELGQYRVEEGIHFPAYVDAYFPTESTRMQFDLRTIHLNRPIDNAEFNVRQRAWELGLAAQNF